MENFSISLHQLLTAMSGGVTDSSSRLDYYRLPLQGIAASPLLGALPGTNALLSQHSDLLDLLSALGLLGGAAFFALIWFLGRGGLKGFAQSEAKPHLLLQWAALLALGALSIVTYSREIPLVICLGAALVMEVPPLEKLP
jgi:O-antigen ligase